MMKLCGINAGAYFTWVVLSSFMIFSYNFAFERLFKKVLNRGEIIPSLLVKDWKKIKTCLGAQISVLVIHLFKILFVHLWMSLIPLPVI